MKKIFAYFKHPTESIAKEDSASIKSLVLFYFLIIGIYILTAIPFAVAGIIPENKLNHIEEFGIPFFVIAFLPPVLEELAFRLSLKRNRINLMISLMVLAWFISAKTISVSVYSMQYLLIRLTISISVGSFLGYFLFQCVKKVRFVLIFYFFAFLFGFIHILNYAGQITSFAIVLYVIIYLLNKVAMGMFLGYIRVRYNILVSIAVHFLNNFLPLVLIYDLVL